MFVQCYCAGDSQLEKNITVGWLCAFTLEIYQSLHISYLLALYMIVMRNYILLIMGK